MNRKKEEYLKNLFENPFSSVDVCVFCGDTIQVTCGDYTPYTRPVTEYKKPGVPVTSPYKKMGIDSYEFDFPREFWVCESCFRKHEKNLHRDILIRTLPYAIKALEKRLEALEERKEEIRRKAEEELKEIEEEIANYLKALETLNNVKIQEKSVKFREKESE
jgi:hypothetical protein